MDWNYIEIMLEYNVILAIHLLKNYFFNCESRFSFLKGDFIKDAKQQSARKNGSELLE